MGVLDKIVDAAKSTSPVAPAGNEAAGLKAKKDNIAEYMKAVGPPNVLDTPKATPAQTNPDKIHPNSKYGSRPGEKRLDVEHMSFKNGTTSVPKTGMAKVHKGEAIIPEKENPMSGLFDKVPGRTAEKPPKKEIKHIVTSKTHDGKFLHKHVHHHPAHEDELHVSNDAKERDAHMAAHMDGGADSDVAQMTAAPAPVAPVAPAAPAASAAPGM